MNQVVSSHGLRTVKQKMCSTLDEAITFAKNDLQMSVETGTDVSSINLMKDGLVQSRLQSQQKNDIDQHVGLLGKGSNLPTRSDIEGKDEKDSASVSSSYCVVKPSRGVASDDVYFCKSLDDIKIAFQKIHQTPIFGCAAGSKHESVVRM